MSCGQKVNNITQIILSKNKKTIYSATGSPDNHGKTKVNNLPRQSITIPNLSSFKEEGNILETHDIKKLDNNTVKMQRNLSLPMNLDTYQQRKKELKSTRHKKVTSEIDFNSISVKVVQK